MIFVSISYEHYMWYVCNIMGAIQYKYVSSRYKNSFIEIKRSRDGLIFIMRMSILIK